jgi:RNA polymerase sigma-70 factor (ECF subfamily)
VSQSFESLSSATFRDGEHGQTMTRSADLPEPRAFDGPRPHAGSVLDDSESLRRALAGFWPVLKPRALRLSRDPAVAEDLVQDTLERALRFHWTYQPGSNLRAWLHKILLSVFISRCRRLRRERRAMDALAGDPCAWTQSDTPEGLQTLLPSMDQAIRALPPQFACVVRLVDLGEQSYQDAAERLGIPVGTVMSRLHRGRRLLATALGEPRDVARAA